MTSSLAKTGTARGLTGSPTRLAGPTGLALVQGLSARVIYIALGPIFSPSVPTLKISVKIIHLLLLLQLHLFSFSTTFTTTPHRMHLLFHSCFSLPLDKFFYAFQLHSLYVVFTFLLIVLKQWG